MCSIYFPLLSFYIASVPLPLLMCSSSFLHFYTAGATLIFSVELVEIQQKPLISIPRGSGFYTFLGVVAVILLIAYEMYKRTRQHSEEIKKQKKAHSSRPQKGKKTKKN